MKQKETNILNIEQLLSYIEDNYDHHPRQVINIVQKALDVMIYTFGDFDSKEVFINKVANHHQFIQGLEDSAEAPLFLTDKPKPRSEFSIKDVAK